MDSRRIPFVREDEECIASAGVWGLVVAIASMITSVLGAVLTLSSSREPSSWLSEIISVTIALILGTWLIQASTAFRRVALTDDDDEHFLLLGFTKLRNYFLMVSILIFIALGLIGLLILGALFCSFTA